MARGDSDDSSVPRQLTLDDWNDELSASRSVHKSVEADARRSSRRGVVTSRSQARPVAGTNGRDESTRAAPALLTTNEAATVLHVHPRTVQRLVERGQLEAVHLGAAVRFDPADVADLTKRLKRREAAEPPLCADTLKPSRVAHFSFADRLRSKTA